MSLTWLPNLLSLCNLFCGFTSMLAALRGRFDLAVIFISVSMLLDLFDGYFARKLKAHSQIGKELDSFADLLSFGIAPGVIFYAAFLGQSPIYDVFKNPQQTSYIIHLVMGSLSFIFPLFATLRLAKFNTMERTDYFKGCPSPIAGATAVFLIAFSKIPGFFVDGFLKPVNFSIPYQIMVPVFLLLAIIMMIPVKFGKMKNFFYKPKSMNVLSVIFINAGIFVVLIIFFKFILLLISLIYIMSSILISILKREKA